MALYTVNISSAGSSDVVSLTDGSTYATLEVSAGRGPKGDGWTGVTYDNGTGRFTFTSTDGLGYVSDSITGDLDTAVTEAEAAQAAAEAAQAATENIFDQFGDQYLGPKASDPTVDNDGDPLTEGDIYFNTTDDVLKFYSGTAWVAPEVIATNAATAAQAAQTAAETAETNAETAETNAATSASNASTSETNAANSATAAAASATEAQGYAASINPDNIDINGGTIDGTVIGGSTPAAGSFTTLSASTSITGTLATAAQTNITSVGTLTGLTVSGSTSLAGASTSADITFGDNDKAIFGAGSDLQIYHDGSNSFVKDVGNGDLILQGSDTVRIRSAGGENLAIFNADGSSTLQHNNLTKLATTSTGIDVTGQLVADSGQFDGNVNIDGTVTADGLTVETSGAATIAGTDSGHLKITHLSRGGDYRFQTSGVTAQNLRLSSAGSQNLAVFGANGDISFYEDTGTTPKFFWDASAERLGIGTSSPSNKLHVKSAGSGTVALFGDSDANNYLDVTRTTTYPSFVSLRAFSSKASLFGGPTLAFETTDPDGSSAIERMRIDSSGNVGIGTSSPSGTLTVKDSAAKIHLTNDANTGSAEVTFRTTTGSNRGFVAYNFDSDYMFFRTGGSGEAMRIDSSGNVGIGTSSPARPLSVSRDSTSSIISSFKSANTQGAISFQGSATTSDTVVRIGAEGNELFAVAGGSEAMRIDSSGNLLVGTTSASGKVRIKSDVNQGGDSTALTLHQGNSGNGGTTLIKLGTEGNGWSKGAIGFKREASYDRGKFIFCLENTGNTADVSSSNEVASIDRSGSLTLSGGVYLGGTGSANKLDDYETGTWTPALNFGTSITYTSQSGVYTKIGDTVHASFVFEVSNSDTSDGSEVHVSLPFTSDSGECVFTPSAYNSDFIHGGTNGAPSTSATATTARLSGNTVVVSQYNGARLSYSDCQSSGRFSGSVVFKIA